MTGDLNNITVKKDMEKKGYIYFMTNRNNSVLYTGITNSLKRRIQQIKHYKRDRKNELVDLMNPNWKDLTGNIIVDPDIV